MKIKKFNLLKWLIILSPAFLCLFGILSCLIPYYVTVYYNGAQSITTAALIKNKSNKLHFISVYTNYLPSSGIFTTCLSITNYFFLIVILVKYFLLRNIYEKLENNGGPLRFLNNLSLVIGFFININSILLQSFHSHTNKQIHNLSSLLTVSFLIIYLWFQTLFTINFNKKQVRVRTTENEIISSLADEERECNSDRAFENKVLSIFLFFTRFFLTFLISCLFILCLILINSILQWLTVVLILVYFLTFIIDFYFHDYNFQLTTSNNSSNSGHNIKFEINQQNERKKIVKIISKNFNNNDLNRPKRSSKIEDQQKPKATSLIFTYV